MLLERLPFRGATIPNGELLSSGIGMIVLINNYRLQSMPIGNQFQAILNQNGSFSSHCEIRSKDTGSDVRVDVHVSVCVLMFISID